jgi:F-box-like
MRKFFKSFSLGKNRSKERKADDLGFGVLRQVPPHLIPPCTDFTLKLPAAILVGIFHYVCPHSQDDTYENCEQSAIEDACMLCDLRDLAHCAIACRRWRDITLGVL